MKNRNVHSTSKSKSTMISQEESHCSNGEDCRGGESLSLHSSISSSEPCHENFRDRHTFTNTNEQRGSVGRSWRRVAPYFGLALLLLICSISMEQHGPSILSFRSESATSSDLSASTHDATHDENFYGTTAQLFDGRRLSESIEQEEEVEELEKENTRAYLDQHESDPNEESEDSSSDDDEESSSMTPMADDDEVRAETNGADDGNAESDGKLPVPTLYNPSKLSAPPPSKDEITSEDLELELELSNEAMESTEAEESLFALQEMTEKLKPRPMLSFAPNATKQFFHLHHMKTGGTSTNQLIQCGLRRARNMYKEYMSRSNTNADATSTSTNTLPFASLEECSYSRYLQCIDPTNNSSSAQRCRSSIQSAAVMQYCAPLHQADQFGWLNSGETDVVSVIRHPVDRVWSMFRFQTKSCFKCTPLLDIYRHIENDTLDEFCGEKGCSGVCIPQLLNHETRNLLTDAWDQSDSGGMSTSTDEEKLKEALWNLEHRISLVGVTDELPVFAKMLGKVFPWLAEDITADVLGLVDNDPSDRFLRRRAAEADKGTTCSLPHANASPKNNRCSDGNTNWDLPDQPDKETREAILRHNQMDLRLYEAAKARFALQKQALGLN